MSASIDKRSPELSGLSAAAGIAVAGDPPAMAEVEELPGAAAPVVALAAPAPAPVAALTPAAASVPATAPAAEERTSRAKNPRMLPVVLRGQPPRAGLGS